MTLSLEVQILCAFFIAVGVDRLVQSFLARRQTRKHTNETFEE